ncbi:MAG: UspA protein [Planctomycetaceae bacterium]|nr:UspA protein [Planctomycetaceae bacterium]
MSEAQNILVGVDLSHGDHLISTDLTDAARTVVDRAIELASKSGANLTFFAAIDLPPHTLEYYEDEDPNALLDLGNKADKVLDGLVQKAIGSGVKQAFAGHAVGKSWLELVKRVLRGHHDLLMAGTRDLSDLQTLIFGSTGLKLLRNCPCPVWITRAHIETKKRHVLVADDLSPVGARLIRLGAQIALAEGADLHVLHALEHSWETSQIGIDPRQEAFLMRASQTAESKIQSHLDCPEVRALSQPPKIHVRQGQAGKNILLAISELQIDLLVMATIARSGLAGFIMGNTAERLLPQVTCSVIAVKPDDFKCPITLDS